MEQLYTYKAQIVRVIDGDTVDVDIDLGFGVWMKNERIRISGIDAPEIRTKDKVEKAFGYAATDRVVELLGEESILVSEKFDTGKFGRIIGDFLLEDGRNLSAVLLEEGHALPYGNFFSDENKAILQEENRKKLIEAEKVNLSNFTSETKASSE